MIDTVVCPHLKNCTSAGLSCGSCKNNTGNRSYYEPDIDNSGVGGRYKPYWPTEPYITPYPKPYTPPWQYPNITWKQPTTTYVF